MNLLIIFCLISICHGVPKQTNRNPILLISMDGFRASKLNDFIQKYPNSALKRFVDAGVKADYVSAYIFQSNLKLKLNLMILDDTYFSFFDFS